MKVVREMKVQRKLDNDELERVMCARNDIKQMCNWDDTDRGREYWYGVARQLDAMAAYATTDGKPYVDPEPPIPGGYRKATPGDEGRRDVKFWSPIASEWQGRPFPDASFTSGDRYIVPIEPPMPEGYRKAVAGDEWRADCKVWESKWLNRHLVGSEFSKLNRYIVPIDRVPTDEDARSRPEVMVRDSDGQEWHKHILILVRDCDHSKYKFATTSKMRMEIVCWKYCRHLYPGE